MPRVAWEGAFSYAVTMWLTAFLQSTRTHDEHMIMAQGLVNTKMAHATNLNSLRLSTSARETQRGDTELATAFWLSETVWL